MYTGPKTAGSRQQAPPRQQQLGTGRLAAARRRRKLGRGLWTCPASALFPHCFPSISPFQAWAAGWPKLAAIQKAAQVGLGRGVGRLPCQVAPHTLFPAQLTLCPPPCLPLQTNGGFIHRRFGDAVTSRYIPLALATASTVMLVSAHQAV